MLTGVSHIIEVRLVKSDGAHSAASYGFQLLTFTIRECWREAKKNLFKKNQRELLKHKYAYAQFWFLYGTITEPVSLGLGYREEHDCIATKC